MILMIFFIEQNNPCFHEDSTSWVLVRTDVFKTFFLFFIKMEYIDVIMYT